MGGYTFVLDKLGRGEGLYFIVQASTHGEGISLLKRLIPPRGCYGLKYRNSAYTHTKLGNALMLVTMIPSLQSTTYREMKLYVLPQ